MDSKEKIDKSNLLRCIGVDDKFHVCVSWENKCLCGVPVKIKNPDDKIYNKRKYIFSCYKCTY